MNDYATGVFCMRCICLYFSEMGGTAKRSSDESSDEQTPRAAVKKDRNGAAENPEYGRSV